MASFDLITLVVLAVAVGGLATVLGEILVKDPRSLAEIITDSRRFAESPMAVEQVPTARRSSGTVQEAAANQNDRRLAA